MMTYEVTRFVTSTSASAITEVVQKLLRRLLNLCVQIKQMKFLYVIFLYVIYRCEILLFCSHRFV